MIGILSNRYNIYRDLIRKLELDDTTWLHGQPPTTSLFDRLIFTCGYRDFSPRYVNEVKLRLKSGVEVELISCCELDQPI